MRLKRRNLTAKQFEFVDKTDKKSKLEGETKRFFKEIENQ